MFARSDHRPIGEIADKETAGVVRTCNRAWSPFGRRLGLREFTGPAQLTYPGKMPQHEWRGASDVVPWPP